MPRFRVGKPRLRLDLVTSYQSANGVQNVLFDTLVYLQGQIRWVSDSTIGIDLAGLYLVTACYMLDGSGAVSARSAFIMRNGAVQAQDTQLGTVAEGPSLSTMVELDLGDTVELLVRGDGVHDIVGFGGRTTLTVTRIGPVRWT